MKIGLVSLGCSKNRVDAEVMLGSLLQQGNILTADPSEADIIIVNTCGFIDTAKKESIDAILEMAEYKKENCKYLVVSGCLSERYIRQLPEELPEVDAFIGVGDYHKIGDVIEKLDGEHKVIKSGKSIPYNQYDRVLTTPNHYAYLKIAEGCNNRCSYCAIPMIKGPYKSGEYETVVAEAKKLVEKGARELVLIAQDTTRFGMETGKYLLPKLIDELCQMEDLVWLRILYAYPECVSDELIQTMVRNPKVCRYLDVPIQHISDAVLRQMNRTVDQKQIKELFRKLKDNDFVIRTTLIVGFPEETADDFKQLYDFVKSERIDRLGVFPYSQEENTSAAKMPQVPEEIKQQRFETIMSLQNEISRELNEERIGKTYQVLIEGFEEGIAYGRSYAEAPEIDGKVYVEGMDLEVGKFYPVTITQASQYDVYGVKADEPTK